MRTSSLARLLWWCRPAAWCLVLSTSLSLVIAAMEPAEAADADSPRLQPSGLEAVLPTPGESFPSYIARNEERIRAALTRYHYAEQSDPFGPGYPLERVVQMRAPYEILPVAQSCAQSGAGDGAGFLLIHGLTDSPYLLRNVAASLARQYPCAILRGILLPGHGTVPGDSLTMRHEDWLQVTDYGVESFRNEVDSLYLVGFSTGTSLSVRYVDAHRDDTLISGLIMLSPALAASSGAAFLAPWLRWFSDWLGAEDEGDAARYESFSVNAGAEFYLLTRGLTRAGFEPLRVPVFMAGSGDDTTVSMEAARRFFCAKTPAGKRQMLWYSAKATASNPEALCEGMTVVAAESPAYRVVSLAHTSISMAPEDPHYGVDGAYSICLHYGAASEDFKTCRTDNSRTVYGERNLARDGRHAGMLVRRGSFNPHYEQLLEAMVCFIDGDC